MLIIFALNKYITKLWFKFIKQYKLVYSPSL